MGQSVAGMYLQKAWRSQTGVEGGGVTQTEAASGHD